MQMLPCPFCGSTKTRWISDLWFVACDMCGATGPSNSKQELAEAAWNVRLGIKEGPE
jgi:Lar family restriction alleviation protein